MWRLRYEEDKKVYYVLVGFWWLLVVGVSDVVLFFVCFLFI